MKSTTNIMKKFFVGTSRFPAGNLNAVADNVPNGAVGMIDLNTNMITTNLPAHNNQYSAGGSSEAYRIAVIAKANDQVWISPPIANFGHSRPKVTYKEHVEEVLEEWSGAITNCGCTESALLNIQLNTLSLISENGLSGQNMDNYVEVTPKEIECYCSCEEVNVYTNHILTKLFFEKIKESDSPFYDAFVTVGPTGTRLDTKIAVNAHIEANKAANTDNNTGNNTAPLYLHIVTKSQKTKFGSHGRNYLSPSGVTITPAFIIDGEKPGVFTKVTNAVFPVGLSADMKAEEWDCINLQTNNNFVFKNSDGTMKDYDFQVDENIPFYDTCTITYLTEKSGAGSTHEGDLREETITIASPSTGANIAHSIANEFNA